MPTLIILGGPMGSGKTTVAKQLHQQIPQTALLGIDRIKWTLSGFTRTKEENALTGRVVLAMAEEYLKHDKNVILDQGFMNEEYLKPYQELAKKYDAKTHIYQLEAPQEELLRRLNNREKPPQAQKKLSEEKTLKNIQTYHEHKRDVKTYDTSKMSPEEITQDIREEIQ